MRNLRVNGERLWQSLMEMGRIGETAKGGCRRLALTDLDRQARDLLIRWCHALGCRVTVDRMGNIFARRAGAEDRPPIMTGSHLDTVPTGGKFDGIYGVMAALEVLRTLDEAGVATRAPVELVVWTNEEGSRFVPPMIGSAVFAGASTLEFGLSRVDADGTSLDQALAAIGYIGEEPCGGRPVGAYLEAHNEQGPVLEDAGVAVGIVTHSYSVRAYEITVTGEDAHVGPTAMARRRNSLVGAAHAIVAIDTIGARHAPVGRAGVPFIQAKPNVRGVLPGETVFSCDFRHETQSQVGAMEGELRQALARLEIETGMGYAVNHYWTYGPEAFDHGMVATLREAAAAIGVRAMDVPTVAGHDAVHMNRITPTAMIFARSARGISHNETEYSSPEDLADGANLLLHAVLARAEAVG